MHSKKCRLALKLPIDVLALGAGAQDHDAERQIAGQFFEQPDFLRGEGVGLRSVHAESAEYDSAFVLYRQRDAGKIASLQRFGAPRDGGRIGGVVLEADGAAGANGGSDRAASPIRLGPGDLEEIEIPVIESGRGDRAHALGLVVFGETHPRHAVSGFLANDAADVVEQSLLVDRAHQRLVAHADGSVFANQAGESLLRRPWREALSADVQHV